MCGIRVKLSCKNTAPQLLSIALERVKRVFFRMFSQNMSVMVVTLSSKNVILTDCFFLSPEVKQSTKIGLLPVVDNPSFLSCNFSSFTFILLGSICLLLTVFVAVETSPVSSMSGRVSLFLSTKISRRVSLFSLLLTGTEISRRVTLFSSLLLTGTSPCSTDLSTEISTKLVTSLLLFEVISTEFSSTSLLTMMSERSSKLSRKIIC